MSTCGRHQRFVHNVGDLLGRGGHFVDVAPTGPPFLGVAFELGLEMFELSLEGRDLRDKQIFQTLNYYKLPMEERKNKRFEKSENSIQKHQPVNTENQLIKRGTKI